MDSKSSHFRQELQHTTKVATATLPWYFFTNRKKTTTKSASGAKVFFPLTSQIHFAKPFYQYKKETGHHALVKVAFAQLCQEKSRTIFCTVRNQMKWLRKTSPKELKGACWMKTAVVPLSWHFMKRWPRKISDLPKEHTQYFQPEPKKCKKNCKKR